VGISVGLDLTGCQSKALFEEACQELNRARPTPIGHYWKPTDIVIWDIGDASRG